MEDILVSKQGWEKVVISTFDFCLRLCNICWYSVKLLLLVRGTMLTAALQSKFYEESKVEHQSGRGPSGWIIPQTLKRMSSVK